MGMSDNQTVTINVLWCSVVGGSGIGEGAGGEIRHLNLDVEVLVGRDCIAVLGFSDDRRDHLVNGRDITHG